MSKRTKVKHHMNETEDHTCGDQNWGPFSFDTWSCCVDDWKFVDCEACLKQKPKKKKTSEKKVDYRVFLVHCGSCGHKTRVRQYGDGSLHREIE